MARVVVFDEFGEADVLRIVDEPIDQPGPAEVRVRVEAFGVNRLDQMMRVGQYPAPIELPHARLGVEGAGIVDAVGSGVEGVAIGDEVIITAVPDPDIRGTYAEYTVVPASRVIQRPNDIDAVGAAALWVSYSTAYGALIEKARLRPGDHVLITAASSGLGLAAIQVANQIGAVPIAVTRSPDKRNALLRAGAAAVFTSDSDDIAAAAIDLATSSPDEAAREVERCIVDLGLNGVMVHTLTGGDFLDTQRYWAIFEAAEYLRAPVYLHPSVPPAAVAATYYGGLGDAIGGVLGTGAPGWHYQTGVALLRLILSGLFDRLPNLQIIVGHWGEMILFYLDRIALLDGFSNLKRPLHEYFRSNVYVTPGGIASHRYLRWAVEVVGIDRIMHATDYPFNSAHDFSARDFLTTSPLSVDDQHKIASGNWNAILRHVRRTR